MSSGDYKAVCYQCSFEGERDATRCPVCRFPLILEPENTPPGGRRVTQILSRSSVREGGPLLPGVDAEKRQAQIRAEQRRAVRRTTSPPSQPAMPTQQLAHAALSAHAAQAAVETDGRGWQALKYTFLCATAVVAGVIAAALQTGHF